MIITHFKRIDTQSRWFGIDIFDGIGVIASFSLFSMISENLYLNLSCCALIYLGLRLLKATKPRGWLIDWLKYYLTSPYYSAARTEGHHE